MEKQLDRATKRIKAERDDFLGRVDAEIEKCDREEKRLRDQLHQLEEKKKSSAAAHGNLDVSDDDLVEVNAGGEDDCCQAWCAVPIEGNEIRGII